METKFIACFFTLSLDKFDDIEQTLLNYDVGKYLIGFEITPDAKKKEHFHLLFEATEQIYNNFSKVIIERYGLRCKGKGQKKHGKVKDIRDIEKMCSYTIKGGNYRSNGFPEEEIKSWYEKSFEKQNGREVSKEIFAYLDKKISYNKYEDTEYTLKKDEYSKCFYPETNALNLFKKVQKEIITFLITEEIEIGTPKPYVSRHAYLWIQNTKTLKKTDKINILCYLIA